ncbi:hypothetical protein BDZ85DRAFT_261425 [Elsinoe ampelina]|uniref:Pentacotripeptide-repeat region of PRORP domain-containing protein n=1 Tax=Elsinoe ampelina TaxID=302913 RepID=A0A6A6GC99_9PEZI|nr:hypothetical protein BDZ85DRAFT_261425 [Elsinoe ampelina]
MTLWRRQIQCLIDDPARPLLPWLAPRVFQPWPEFTGRRHASAATRQDGRSTSDNGRISSCDTQKPRVQHIEAPESTPTRRPGAGTTCAIEDRTKFSVTTYMWRDKRKDKKKEDITSCPKIIKVFDQYKAPELSDKDFWNPNHVVNKTPRNRADEWYEAILGLDQQTGKRDIPNTDAKGIKDPKRAGLVRRRRWFKKGTVKVISQREPRGRRFRMSFIKTRKRSTYQEALERFQARKATARRKRYLRDVSISEHTLTIRLGRRWWKLDHTKPTDSETDFHYLFGDFSWKWLRWMARLKRPYFTGLQPQSFKEPGELDPAAQKWAHDVLFGQKRARHIQADLSSVSERRHRVWEEALLWILQHSPDDAFFFLRKSHVRPLPPQYMVGQALEYLILRATTAPHLDDQELKVNIGKCIAHVSRRPQYDPLHVDGSHLAWLFKTCTGPTTILILEALEKAEFKLPLNTRLHVIQKLASQEDTLEAAIQQLGKIGETPTFNHELIRKACFTIMHRAMRRKDGGQLCVEALGHLVSSGINLNVQVCTIVMLNAVRSRDANLAFRVYNMILENKVEPDKYLFVALIRACKLAPEEGERLAAVIETALRMGVLLTSKFVATEVLDALYRHHKKVERPDTFKLIVESYNQLFNNDCLMALEMVPQQQTTQPKTIMPAEAPPLGIVIRAWLSHGQPRVRDVLLRYRLIRHLAKLGRSPFRELLQSDHLSNEFIAWFATHMNGIQWVTEVVRNMEEDAWEPVLSQGGPSPDESVTADETLVSEKQQSTDGSRTKNPIRGKPTGFSPPTRTTLSILHFFLCRHAKPTNDHIQHAERVLEQMLAHNQDIDHRHWISMLYAYKRVHDIDAALWCVDKMIEHGCWNNEKGENMRTQLLRLRKQYRVQDGLAARQEEPKRRDADEEALYVSWPLIEAEDQAAGAPL